MVSVNKIVVVLALICSSVFSADIKYDKQGWVNDFAGIMTDSEKADLTAKLVKLHDGSGVNFLIVTTPSLDGEDIKQWSIDLSLKWRVGKNGEDNGLVYVIAPNERKWRIEVGYGLEGKLPDGKVTTIGKNYATQYFKDKQYYAGIDAVATALIGDITGAAPIALATTQPASSHDVFWIIFLIVVATIIVAMVLYYCDGLGGGSGSGGGGSYSIFDGGGSSSASDSSSSDSGGSFGGGGGDGGW